MLHDREARQFFAVRDAVKHAQPALAMLENVPGIKRIMPEVLKELGKCGGYITTVVSIDPAKLGADVRRPRFYFLMWRRDVLKAGATTERVAAQANKLLGKLQEELGRGVKDKWENLILPESSLPVKRLRATQQQETKTCKCGGCKGKSARGANARMNSVLPRTVRCKWRRQHYELMKEHGLKAADVDGCSRALTAKYPGCISSPRYRHVLDIAVAIGKQRKEQVRAVDISQRPSQSWKCLGNRPLQTLSPSGRFFACEASRELTGHDKAFDTSLPSSESKGPATSKGTCRCPYPFRDLNKSEAISGPDLH
jgi:site-specific DNA-cytosine methylase